MGTWVLINARWYYYAAADGGDGFFAWDANSTEPDDGGIIIASIPSNLGRCKRCTRGEAINVKWFGATGDGMTDDTAAIQAALKLQDGPVFLPAGDYVVTQLELYSGSQIYGVGSGAAPNMGTRLHQKPGSNLSLIVPVSTMPANEWIHWAQIRDLQLRGNSVATAGCGIDMTRRTGENFLISNVLSIDFPESGIRLTRGSTPGGIFNCACFGNGEYGFDLQRNDGDVWHQFAVRSVSGDNNGIALIRVKNYGSSEDQISIRT